MAEESRRESLFPESEPLMTQPEPTPTIATTDLAMIEALLNRRSISFYRKEAEAICHDRQQPLRKRVIISLEIGQDSMRVPIPRIEFYADTGELCDVAAEHAEICPCLAEKPSPTPVGEKPNPQAWQVHYPPGYNSEHDSFIFFEQRDADEKADEIEDAGHGRPEVVPLVAAPASPSSSAAAGVKLETTPDQVKRLNSEPSYAWWNSDVPAIRHDLEAAHSLAARVTELEPYRDAIHATHNGYHGVGPVPASPAAAIKELLDCEQGQIDSLAEQVATLTAENAELRNSTDQLLLDKAKLMRLRIDESADRDRMRLVIERDRTGFTEGLNRIRRELDSRRGMAESRGSYEWDDDAYRKEFSAALDAIAKEVTTAEEISHAHDLSDSARDAGEVQKSRHPYDVIASLSRDLAEARTTIENAYPLMKAIGDLLRNCKGRYPADSSDGMMVEAVRIMRLDQAYQQVPNPDALASAPGPATTGEVEP